MDTDLRARLALHQARYPQITAQKWRELNPATAARIDDDAAKTERLILRADLALLRARRARYAKRRRFV